MREDLTLVIANKNYSSWSLRPWLVLTELEIPFSECMLKFDSKAWLEGAHLRSPSGLVPVLWEGEPGKGFATFDSLAIVERLHELFPHSNVWPTDALARSRARSLASDFHAGYSNLRSSMPMNIRSRYSGEGNNTAVQTDINRICHLWRETRRNFGLNGGFLFGEFSAIDAYYTPVASRLKTYGVALDSVCFDYQQALLNTPSMLKWTAEALKEKEFVAGDEPYAKEKSNPFRQIQE